MSRSLDIACKIRQFTLTTQTSRRQLMTIRYLSPDFAVSDWLAPEDFARVRALGFERVINFRPDGEAAGQHASVDAASAAGASGLDYVHLPTTKFELFAPATLEGAAKALANGRRTLGYCASGTRAAIIWAANAARTSSVDDVLAAVECAGFALAFIRDDLEASADRRRWTAINKTEDQYSDGQCTKVGCPRAVASEAA